MQSKEISVEENVGLVRALVPRFLGRGFDYDDLFQAGCIGLVKAVERFDSTLGYQFSTYAVPLILGEMRRLFRDGGTVKISRSLKELSLKAMHLAEEIETKTGEAPTVSVLAARMGITEEKCVDALNAAQLPVSLTSFEGEGEQDIPVESHEERVSDRLALQQILSSLPETDRNLLEYRYFQRKTQVETAKRLGISQVQVSRREKKLLMQLRSMLI
ncbi:MAG: sigma-70 family RNA polymerase sigma factor [Clostridia bacterium]|nr:sigma-70 family RNA polymerase sigma factor [Clostridia bacterium]